MNSPFRVLYRLFLFRLTDVEFLSAHAQGDSSKLLGQFASLLIFLSVLFSLAAFGVPGKAAHPQARLIFEWSSVHFLIATTMLVVGLFAVLNWESVLPDRRDVLLVGPLPVTTRTFFLAKVAAVAAALTLSVGLLHFFAGLIWPFALNAEAPQYVVPSFRGSRPVPIRGPADLDAALHQALAPMLRERPEAGIAVGIYQRGRRHVFAYGTARRDSIFEIGSVTKTFTGLLLARMVIQGEAHLDEPVRELLPKHMTRKPYGAEITLLDLATHRSGLPGMPPGFRPTDPDNPFADFHESNLYSYLAARGLGKRGNPPVAYSNLGYGLLGYALANRSGKTFAALVTERIATPMGLKETTVQLDESQRARLMEGRDWRHRPVPPLDLDVIAPAGALRSTVDDMMTYVEAQLRPEKVADTHLANALRLSQQPRARVGARARIGLAWFFDSDTDFVGHGGATIGHTAFAGYRRARDEGVVVLSSTGPSTAISADAIGQHVLARIDHRPAFAIEHVRIPARGGVTGFARSFLAYWAVMLMAGAFMFCSVLCLQGVAAQILPRRVFLRVAPLLQLLAFVGIVAGYLFQPIGVGSGSVLDAQSGGIQGWSPSYWFLGLFQQWRDSPMMGPLARRAWIASGSIGCATVLVWVAAYYRTMRRVVEEPDISPGGRAPVPGLPRFGGPFGTAITQFSIRTMLRSRQHRLLLAFFTGVAFAVAIFFVKTPLAQREIAEVTTGDLWHEPTAPILTSTVVVLGLWLLAVRIGFSLPFEIGANWIFQVTPLRGQSHCLSARRRAMFVTGLLPALVFLAGACWAMWPWRPALAHAAVLSLLGAIIAEFCAGGAQKIPFTCSHLPGRTNIHVTFWLALGLLMKILDTAAEWERQALANLPQLSAVVVSLGLAALLARWMVDQLAAMRGPEPQFEAEPSDAILSLGLDGDHG